MIQVHVPVKTAGVSRLYPVLLIFSGILIVFLLVSGDHSSISSLLGGSLEGGEGGGDGEGRTIPRKIVGGSSSSSTSSRASGNSGGEGGAEKCEGAGAASNANALPLGEVVTAWEAMKRGRYSNVPNRKCIVGTFGSDWDHMAWLMENSSIPFAIARYGDGERNLILGKEIGQGTQAFSEDKFWFEGGESELGRDLAWSLTGHFGQQYYYGFASPIDDGAGLRWYLQHTHQQCPYITYANLFVNKNYQRTKALLLRLFETQIKRMVIIANYEGMQRFIDLYRPPPEVRYLSLPDDAPHFYKGSNRKQLIGNATALARSKKGSLFIVSGGPMAKPLIAHMWNANPLNQYVDVGSSLDEIFKGRKTRPYMTPGNQYSEQSDPAFTIDENDRPVLVNYDYLGG